MNRFHISIIILALILWFGGGCIHSLKPEAHDATFTPVKVNTAVREVKVNRIGSDKKIYGVTLDSLQNLDAVIESLRKMKFKPTVRVVFDEKAPAVKYVEPLKRLHEVSYVMGELADSFFMKKYSVSEYRALTREYLDTLGALVDIWEFGNEVNGEWLGRPSDVASKITKAFEEIDKRKKVSALTLYYNEGCWEKADSQMFNWVKKNLPAKMRQKIDYVFISYYEDDCQGIQPDWDSVFSEMARLFPESSLGFGEVGSKDADRKAEYIKKYYSMQLSQSRYVGGYFWWYFSQDMVPDSKPLWEILNSSFIE